MYLQIFGSFKSAKKKLSQQITKKDCVRKLPHLRTTSANLTNFRKLADF
jgi:hypothetical protein